MEVDTKETVTKYLGLYSGNEDQGFQIVPLGPLADFVGIPQVLVRFLIALLFGYPLSLIYLLLLKESKSSRKHLYFTYTGIWLTYFCFGVDCLYNILSVILAFLTLSSSKRSVILTIIFQTAFLMYGYVLNASKGGYRVTWTIPQCIFCLRFISLAWNLFDGQQNDEDLTIDQKRLSLKEKPSILELFGYCYCFCGLLSGLQYSFKRYTDFIEDVLVSSKDKHKSRSRYKESLKRFGQAWIIVIAFILSDPHFRYENLLNDSFLTKPFLLKVMQMSPIWLVQTFKYVIVWWFGESLSILVGLSANGTDPNGNLKWDGTLNFQMRKVAFGKFHTNIIEGFNMLTNLWARNYLFRRLKILNNKLASHLLTLLYLAVWHGFFVGYYIMFIMEFVIVVWEKNYSDVLHRVTGLSFKDLSKPVQIVLHGLLLLFKFCMCGFGAVPFLLLSWEKINILYSACYYWPAIVVLTWFAFIGPVLKLVFAAKSNQSLKKCF